MTQETTVLLRRWTMVGDRVIHSRETADSGTAAGCPVILLHGVGVTSRYFRPLLQSLDGRVPAAAPELPGIGSTPSGDLPRDIAGLADVVAAWLRTTHRWPARLVGNSVGAQVAVEVAARHPGLVEGLVLIGPTIDAQARSLRSQLYRLLVDATVERPSLVATSISDALFTNRRAVWSNLFAALDHRIEDRLPSLELPVLVIRGERDPIVPRRWARALADAAPRGELLEIAGGAHACHHGRPHAVADVLVRTAGPTCTGR